jgi:hypothetical protein
MAEEQKRVMYGKDDMTLSINDRRPGSGDGRKTEDWHADWGGQLVVGGKTYYVDLYQKNGSWIAGKLKPAKKDDVADEIPF